MPCIKLNLKRIIVLNVNPKTIKFLKEYIGKNLCDFDLDTDFLDTTPKAGLVKGK